MWMVNVLLKSFTDVYNNNFHNNFVIVVCQSLHFDYCSIKKNSSQQKLLKEKLFSQN